MACTYATLSFGHYKNSEILTEFQPNLPHYKHYIDDILGIWIPSENNTNKWESFKRKLNSWGTLKWIIENPSYNTQFLDLNLRIENNSITTETYQKTINPYLYILPRSAHPSSCFKGLIFGELRRYWIQNTPEKFQEILQKFIQRLIDRGHTLDSLIPLLTEAAANFERKLNDPTPQPPNN